EERRDGDDKNGKRQDRVVVDEGESAENGHVLSDGQTDIRRGLGRTVGGESRRSFCGVRDQTRGTAEQNNQDVDDRRMMPEDLKGEKRAADRPNDRVDRVPG